MEEGPTEGAENEWLRQVEGKPGHDVLDAR